MKVSQLVAFAGLGQEMVRNVRVMTPPSVPTAPTSHARAETRLDTSSPHVTSQRTMHHGPPPPQHGLSQDMVHVASWMRGSPASQREIAIPPYMPQRLLRGAGDPGDPITPGDYHIVGTQVQLRAAPDATSAVLGTLQNGEGVYAFGDVTTDPAYMVDPNTHTAVPNDGSSPGIDYVHVGTQTLGAGYVAINFITPGAGAPVQPPVPVPVPNPPAPTPTPTPPAPKSYVVPVLVGGAIGATVLLGGALLYRASKKSHTHTRAFA